MSFTTTTLTHTFLSADGSPATGRVQFTLTKGVTSGSATLLPVSVVTELDDTGAMSQVLTSNVDPGSDPPDSKWRVDLRLDGVQPQTYFITVPSGGQTIDLGTLLPTEGSTVPVDITTQWQPFLDVEWDVKPFLNIKPGTTQFDTALQDITAAICEAMQTYIGQPIPPTEFFRRYEGAQGWRSEFIQLPFWPVIGTPTVTEYWYSSVHPLTERTPTSANANTSDMFAIDRLKGLVTRVFGSGPGIARPFFPGQGARNVEIRWTAGYNPIPQQLRLAALEWVNDWYRASQEALRAGRPTMEYGGAESAQFYKAMPNHVTQMLQPFTHVSVA